MDKKLLSEKVFQNELNILRDARSCLNNGNNNEQIKENYKDLCNNYESLLGVARLLTSVSDRLHLRLDKANKKLKAQAEEIHIINENLHENNEKLKETIEALARANIGRRSASIVLVIAIALFVFSEAYIEPIVEDNVNNENIGLFIKGVIALLLKPIDMLVERYLVRRKIKEHNQEVLHQA